MLGKRNILLRFNLLQVLDRHHRIHWDTKNRCTWRHVLRYVYTLLYLLRFFLVLIKLSVNLHLGFLNHPVVVANKHVTEVIFSRIYTPPQLIVLSHSLSMYSLSLVSCETGSGGNTMISWACHLSFESYTNAMDSVLSSKV